ncbi:HEAT repeat domain-containing protein [Halobacillus yeomjeoni]|uniref:HEAT repeat domain-containing protein n=1 Tax=Halobacillus yeomjeoni TaxID=311194 RepID=UPI001CD41CC6|nr:HEAT repeat domain-containing protein [Halobacillus yeomjeoni]MCA0983841.1 HEAT repeat domain-containing protein [Halobacillus yeomjeoni]
MLRNRAKKMQDFHAKVYPLVIRYITTGYDRPVFLISSSAKWQRQVIKEIAIQIAGVINSEKEIERLNIVIEDFGVVKEVETMLKDKRWWIVSAGVNEATELHLKQFVPIIKQHLYTEEYDLRRSVVRALCEMGESIEVLNYMVIHENELPHKVIVHIGDMLVSTGSDDPTLIDYIVQHFHQVSPELQGVFLEIIGKRKAMNQLPLLTTLLRREEKEIRLKAMRAIGDIGMILEPEAIFDFLFSSSWEERVLAIYVIQSCKLEQAIPELVNHSIQDKNWWVRVRAAETLYAFGEKGRKELKDVADTHEDIFAKDIANKVLQEKHLRGS